MAMAKKIILSETDIENIIKDYTENKQSLSSIGKKFNKSYLIIKQILIDNGIILRTKEEDLKLRIERYEATCLETYGVTNVSQNTIIKIKKEMTCLANYGVTNPLQDSTIRDKAKKTCVSKYGVDNPSKAVAVKQKKINKVKLINESCTNVFQLEDIKFKIKQTLTDKYGVDNPQKCLVIKAKTQATNLDKYGYTCCLLNEDIKSKSITTNLNKYGVEYFSQTKDFHSKSIKRYKYDNEVFDSLPELALWIYAKDNQIAIERLPLKYEYLFENKVHYYFPDFRYDGKIIEIKNDYLYKQMQKVGTIANAKLECMLKNNVEIWLPKNYLFAVNYCIKKYGKNFKQKFINESWGDANV